MTFDESMNAVDKHFELLIQFALELLMTGRTTVAIAYSLSTVLAVDQILVFERGQVVERGTI